METDRFDVVVVGGGPGGVSAAASAAGAGAKVALVETLDRLGGNAVLSTGYLVFIGTPLQHQHRAEDSIETFMRDGEKQFELESVHGGMIWDRDLTKLFARESLQTYHDLVGLGIKFSRLLAKPSQHSVDRLHALADPGDVGRAYTKRLSELGVTVLFNTEARRLIQDGGRVAGIEAVRRVMGAEEERITLRASRGVILTTGGYQGNFELRRRHQPEADINGHLVGVPTCRGIGHVLGASVGADLINMDYIQPMVLVPSLLVEDAIAVNIKGERFHDETGKYANRVKALGEQPERYGYYIIDGETRKARGDLVERMPQAAVTRDTLEELAAAIGCDAAGLKKSVSEWNAFLAGNGAEDPVTGRTILPEGRRQLIAPPYSAMRMVRSTTFTWGGFAVTLDMQVVNVMGDPVPGLFAAGDTVGGVNVISGMGGLHISPALTLGRIAGRSAVKGASAKPHITAPAQSHNFVTSSGLKMVLFDLADKDPDRSKPEPAESA